MSRIFKRPMFRKGGEVMEGIMTGIKPRENYENGSIDPSVQKSIDMARSVYDPIYSGMAPTKDEILTKLLITGGLRGMSQTGGGGTLGNLAKAFQEPTEQALSESFAGKRAGQQSALKAAEFGLGLKSASELQRIKSAGANKTYESGTIPAITKQIMSALGKNALTEDAQQLAVNIAPKIARIQQAELKNPNILYQGILQMDDKDPSQPDLNWVGTQPDGAVFMNPYDRLFYIKDGDNFYPADQRTYGKPAKEG
jgi:hypothetical protein